MVRRTLACGKKLYSRYGDKSNDSLPWWKQLVLKFYQDCIADGVPEEALDFKNICSVKAVRGVGNGSPVSSEIATRSVMEMLPMMDERGRRHALRIRTAFLVGQGNVDAFFPPYDEQQLPDDHVALATLENNMLRLPDGDVIVTPRQDHSIHFQVHFSDAMEDVQALKQGAGREPMAVLIHLHKAGPHMKEHLDLMSGDPTRQQQIAPMQEGWLMLSKLADQLQQQIEEAMAAEQEQEPQLDPKLVAALAKVQGELEIKRAKMEGDMQLKADKQEFTQRIKDLSTAHSIRLKDRNQASEMMRKLEAPAATQP